MKTKFDQRYIPAFSTREAELKAYATLEDSVKNKMLPVVTLTRQRNAPGFEESISTIIDAAGPRPLIVDFDRLVKDVKSESEVALLRKEKHAGAVKAGKKPKVYTEKQEEAWLRQREATRYFNAQALELQNPADGYSSWRALSLSLPNLIPVAQFGNSVEAIRQVEEVMAVGREIAFRLDLRDPSSVKAFLSAAQGLSKPEDASLILDAGYVRGDVSNGQKLIVDALTTIRRRLGKPAFDSLKKVCMAGSFPSSLRGLPSELRILERDLFEAVVRDGWDVRYGDHASVQHRKAMQAANGWFPHVDISHKRSWHFELREDQKLESRGYINAAKELVKKAPVWDDRADCWGANMVARASAGVLQDVDGQKLTTPGPWLGVRVSQHLKQQALMP